MQFSLENLTQKLSQAHYDPSIGIKNVILQEITIGGEEVQQMLLEMDPGKELVPHLHEKDDEVGVVLTSGTLYFGDAKKENEEYVLDTDGKVIVDWEAGKQYSSGETFTIPAGKAHHFVATGPESLLMLIVLSKTHLSGEDRKFTTHP